MTPSISSSISLCPSTTCRDRHAVQEEMSAAALASLGVTADWTNRAHRCGNCGCVYSVEGESAKARGYSNNPIFADARWLPIYGGK
jgi:hypothetical protein